MDIIVCTMIKTKCDDRNEDNTCSKEGNCPYQMPVKKELI